MRDEAERRLVHATGTVVPMLYVLDILTWQQLRAACVGGVALAIVLETLRLSGRLDLNFFDRLTRDYEQDNPAGYALYTVGVAVTVLLFEPRVAVPSVLMLTIADPASGLLGSGELWSVKRTYVLLATFGISTLLASPFVPSLAAIAGGLAATVADGAKPVVRGYVVDDNLTIPLLAALAIAAALRYLPETPLPG